MSQSSRPTRRSTDLLLQHVSSETLIYDERTHRAFCLNAVAATIWSLLDGTRTPAELSAAATFELGAPVTVDAVQDAVAQFQADGLLAAEHPQVAADGIAAGMLSRRRLMGGMTAGAVVMVPVVAALMTPTPANAYNGQVTGIAGAGNQQGGTGSATGAAAGQGKSSGTPLFDDNVK